MREALQFTTTFYGNMVWTKYIDRE